MAALMLLVLPLIAGAQDSTAGPYARAVATWMSLIATPGRERAATERIMTASRVWDRDQNGNLIRRRGDGSPRRVIACGIDETGYAVSAITDDGYLRVHWNGNGKHPALWDQYHEGQRVIIMTQGASARPRNIPGVFAVRSNHLWRRRVADNEPTSIENLWIDIGARSRAEAERMGVDVLDPVVRDWPEWTFADYVAGPAAGNRAACAAVAAVASAPERPGTGETIFIISTQKSFNWTGLTAALARLGKVDALVIADAELGAGHATPTDIRAPWTTLRGLDIGKISAIGIPARYPGTLVETLREKDIDALHRELAEAAGIGRMAVVPVPVIHGWVAPATQLTRDSLSRYADVLGKLTDIYAPSGHEAPMRTAIRAAMPAWARDSAVVDTAGNLTVAVGPNRDTMVVIAHMDEIGFTITGIAHDGTVSLRQRGTFFPFLWEGQPALLHRDGDQIPSRDGVMGCGAARGGPLRGVFLTRDSATQREPAEVTAWFGMDSAQLVAAGAHVGSPLTSFKCSTRMGDVRLTARSTDDRAGVTSLLLTMEDIDPSKLDHRVIFAFSVREEIGLEGAKALTQELGPSVHRVHAVDTFVSSDSPLESRRFAYAPLGLGAAMRALDNSSVTPPEEVDRVVKIAKASGIPLQHGVTNGGNDGSELARFGAIDVALSWPLRYSHSPAEVIDLRDLRSLTRIVTAVVKAPTKPPTR